MNRQLVFVAGGIIMTASVVSGVVVTTHSSADTATEFDQVHSATATDNFASLSTRFDRPDALQGWQELQVEGWSPKWETPRVENGRLVLQPKSSGWFEDNYGGHLYREIEGDFIVTTRIKVEGTQAALPQRSFSLAGLFIRAPRTFTQETWEPGGENWLFFSTGTAYPAGRPHFEIKSTYNSLSTLKIFDALEGWMRLRVARSGELFTLLYREEGSQEWKVLDQFIRPDLPQTLHVGLTAYADWDSLAADYPNYQQYNEQGAATQNADLVAYVESINFRRPVTPRFPIATLEPSVFSDSNLAEARLRDLMAD